MARKYKILSYADRKLMESMGKSGSNVREIAGVLGTHRDTLYRELKRCGCTTLAEYNAAAGQQTLKKCRH